jgi:hypothetical protein
MLPYTVSVKKRFDVWALLSCLLGHGVFGGFMCILVRVSDGS